jgi:transposase
VCHAQGRSNLATADEQRAATDHFGGGAFDTELLKRAFLGWLRGEHGHCKMVAVPTLAQEDAKRPSRERETLVGEASRIITRVKAAFVRLGARRQGRTCRSVCRSF